MPNPIITGTTGNDTIRFANYGQPSTTNTYTLNLLAGTDTFDFVTGNSYASRFVSTNFTIGAADANGMITVTGASSGGRDHFTFNLTSVESLKFADKTVQLSYGIPVTPTDTTPPTVSAFSPAAGAIGIATGSDIVIIFSEAVQLGSGLIEVHSGSAIGTVVATNTTEALSVSGSMLTINPTANLANGTHYFVSLAAGSIKDLAGNSYAGTTTYDFTTATEASQANDTTPPTVASFSPTAATTGVSISSDIVLTFSEPVQRGIGTIAIHSGSASGAVVESYDASASTNISVSGSMLTINPTTDLANGTHYFVTMAAGSIHDLAGNSYAGTTAYDFTTVSAAVIAPTVVPTTALPANGSSYTAPALVGVGVLGILSWVLL